LLREAHDELEMRVLERTAELAKANTILQAEIVERKQAEQALRESEARLAGILDIAKEAIISVDQTQRIIIFNKGSEAIFGYAADEIIGQPLDLLIPDRFRATHRQHIVEFAAGPVDARRLGERMELYGRRKGGEVFPAEASISKLRLGEQTIFTVVLRDITERKRAETALRESEQRYKKLLGSVTDYIYTVHLEHGQPLHTTHSPNCLAVTGYTSQDYATDPNLWFRMIYEADQPLVTQQSEALLRGEAVPALEHRIIHKDGSIRWVRNTPVLRKDEHGQIRSYDGLIANITERKLAEEALRKSEGKYRRLMEQASDGIILANETGDILEANPRIFDMLGYDRAELLALNIRDLIYREDLADTSFGLEEVQTGRTVLIERRLCRQDGSLIPVETSATRLEDGRLQAILRDITERKRAEAERERLFEEVKAGGERLQALSHRLVEVQEAERRHIARELHDETGQLLTGLKLTLEMSTSMSGEALQANLGEAHSLISELIAQVRELSLELRPAMLDDLGLAPTLLWHFERYTAQTQIQVNFKHSGLDRRFKSEVETTAYRIVQEALTNIARHAKVDETTVRLWLEAEALNVQIEDEGVGFDPEAAQAAATSSGLSGMAERAALLGGRLSIESRPQAGTRLTAQLPLGHTIDVGLDLKT
jgi:PAS domain S-box-containing protein